MIIETLIIIRVIKMFKLQPEETINDMVASSEAQSDNR